MYLPLLTTLKLCNYIKRGEPAYVPVTVFIELHRLKDVYIKQEDEPKNAKEFAVENCL